jgi:hypothetical protein
VNNADGPKYIRLKRDAYILCGRLRHLGSGPDDAGVVDEHVEAAGAGHYVPRGGDRRVVSDIHRHKPGAEAIRGCGAALSIPAGDPHLVAVGQQSSSGLLAEPLVRAGD